MCNRSDLPAVTAGIFNCSGYSIGVKCNLTCSNGYYPSAAKEIVCEESDGFNGNWSGGNFQCAADFQKQFVFTFLPVTGCTKQDTIIQLFIATVAENVSAEGVISFPLQNIPDISFALTHGVGEFFNLPPSVLPSDLRDPSIRRENSSVVVAATDIVSVYGHLRCVDNGIKRTTAFKVRRTEKLGKDYRVVSYRNKGYNEIAVVALENDSFIQVINKENSTEIVNVTLQMYETYALGNLHQMTGIYIKASKPVFVLTGNRGDQSRVSTTGGAVFFECLTPFDYWGSSYYFFPLYKFTGWTQLKIMTWENRPTSNLVLRWRNGNLILTSDLESNTINFEIGNGELGKIQSTNSILVTQFSQPKMLSDKSKDALTLSMIIVPPIPLFTMTYVLFPVFDLTLGGQGVKHYLTVILPVGGHINDLYVNMAIATWQLVGNFDDGSAIFRTILSPGSNLLENRWSYNITAVVSASHDYMSYAFVM